MAASPQTQVVTIPLSGTLSGIVEVRADIPISVLVPSVTSGAIFVLGNWEVNSADFRRLVTRDATSFYAIGLGVGSLGVTLTEISRGWPFLRFETGVAQAAVRSFTVITKV